MRKITEKKSKLNLVLNTLEPHDSDFTLKKATFIILDFEKSGNNAIVDKETALNSLGPTIKNKPIRGYYKEDEENFGGHEVVIKESKNGEKSVERNTVPMGVFTTEGYLGEVEIEGVTREVLLADAVLWYSQFQEPIDLLTAWYEDGMTISMSCEYLYSNAEFIDGVEHQYAPMYFEAHCILGQDVAPAYESAKLVSYNQLKEFKQLVAQLATSESDKEELEVEDNKLALNEMTAKIEELKSSFNEEKTVLNEKLEVVTSEKETLSVKFNEVVSELTELKAEVVELRKAKEELDGINRKAKFNELSEKFSKAFENAGAMEAFNSEEVQATLEKAVDSPEALLSLNMLVVELLTTAPKKEVKEVKEDATTLLGLQSLRKDLIKEHKTIDQEFEELFKK